MTDEVRASYDAVKAALERAGFETERMASDVPFLRVQTDTALRPYSMYNIINDEASTDFNVTMAGPETFLVYFYEDSR